MNNACILCNRIDPNNCLPCCEDYYCLDCIAHFYNQQQDLNCSDCDQFITSKLFNHFHTHSGKTCEVHQFEYYYAKCESCQRTADAKENKQTRAQTPEQKHNTRLSQLANFLIVPALKKG